jgi:hypothetical protein
MTESEIKQLAEECRELAGRIHAPFKAMRSRGPTGGGNVYWWVESWNNLFTYTDAKGRLFGQKIATIDHGCAGEDEANLFAHAGTNYYRIADALEHMQHQLADVTRERDELKAGLDEANAAIDSVIDKVVNAKCVYCDWEGKRFGILEDPDRSKNNAMLAEHVKVCPKHPMRELERKLDEATRRAEEAEAARLRAIGRHSEVCQELADAEIDAEEAKAHLARMRDALQECKVLVESQTVGDGDGHTEHCRKLIEDALSPTQPATPATCPNCERMREAIEVAGADLARSVLWARNGQVDFSRLCHDAQGVDGNLSRRPRPSRNRHSPLPARPLRGVHWRVPGWAYRRQRAGKGGCTAMKKETALERARAHRDAKKIWMVVGIAIRPTGRTEWGWAYLEPGHATNFPDGLKFYPRILLAPDGREFASEQAPAQESK